MKGANLAQSFITLLGEVLKSSPELEMQRRKVNKILRQYATDTRGVSIEKLTLLDVWDGHEDISSEFLSFIRQLPIRKDYQQSQISNLRRLVRVVISENFKHGVSDKAEIKKESIVEANLPEFMRPLWPCLPRSGGREHNFKHVRLDDPSRTALPLTATSEVVLTTLLAVAQEKEINTLQKLLVDYRFDVLRKMEETYKRAKWKPATLALKLIRDRLGYKVPKRIIYSVSIKDLPKTLHEEIGIFLAHATSGLESIPHLSAIAAQFGLRDKPLKTLTSRRYIKAICYGFGFIEWDTDIGVEDLLRLQPVVRSFNRRTYQELHNPYVDQFRERELKRQTKRKRAGRDSVMFHHFVDAVCAVGAFNGICEMQSAFRQAYKSKLDWRTRKEIKTLKKKVFDRGWIDRQIKLLGAQVEQVLKDRTYAVDLAGDHETEALMNLRKCMFYAYFVMLRYTGFRQQCLRDCVLGKNIIFGEDGSITLWWPAGAIKNNREIDTTYSYGEHGETHAIFIKALNAYRKVYRYIEDRFGEDMGGQFFGNVTVRDKRARSFADATTFTNSFKADALMFLDFEDRLAEVDINLTPHFLRGVATDWMKFDLGMTMDQISKAIGSSPKILEREYLDEDRKVDPGGTFVKINETIKRARQKGSAVSMSVGGDASEHSLLKEINRLRSENLEIKMQARRVEARAKRAQRRVLELKTMIKNK